MAMCPLITWNCNPKSRKKNTFFWFRGVARTEYTCIPYNQWQFWIHVDSSPYVEALGWNEVPKFETITYFFGGYFPVIKHGNGKSPMNGDIDWKIFYKWKHVQQTMFDYSYLFTIWNTWKTLNAVSFTLFFRVSIRKNRICLIIISSNNSLLVLVVG